MGRVNLVLRATSCLALLRGVEVRRDHKVRHRLFDVVILLKTLMTGKACTRLVRIGIDGLKHSGVNLRLV